MNAAICDEFPADDLKLLKLFHDAKYTGNYVYILKDHGKSCWVFYLWNEKNSRIELEQY